MSVKPATGDQASTNGCFRARPGAGVVRVLPAQDAEMERRCGSRSQRLAPLRAALRLRDLRRRRLDARAHAQRRHAHRCARPRCAGAPHLTCVGATREEILDIARALLGRRHPAHRGAARRSAGRAGARYVPHPGGFAYAADLVRGLQARSATSTSRWRPIRRCTRRRRAPQFDLDNLKRKIDAGATRAITQFFFDTDAFLRFRDRCARAGIDAQIVPGILPITRFPQMLRFAERCGASVPEWLAQRFDGLDDDPETRR